MNIASGQEYVVLHVKGSITKSNSNTELKPGDTMSADEKIEFGTADAMAAVLHPEKGKYVLKTTSPDNSSKNDLIYLISNVLSPVSGNMSTRSGGINNVLDFRKYFEEGPFVWAGNVLKIEVSENNFPINASHFFFLNYSYQGEEINKKLKSEKAKIIFERNEVFKIDGQPVDEDEVNNYKLFYYNSINEQSSLVANIDFVFVEQNVLEYIYEAYDKYEKEPLTSIAGLFTEMYGKCDPDQLAYNISTE
jgi:hypothetical protein